MWSDFGDPTPYLAKWEPYLSESGPLRQLRAPEAIVKSGRGSVFSMCLRHRTDERFPKYPRLPVERCPGYERRELSGSR